MISSVIQGTTIPVLEQVVNFTQARHQVLAGNIANLDTPDYQVRDLSVETFQQRLQEAIEARQQERRDVTPGVVTDDPEDALHRVASNARVAGQATLAGRWPVSCRVHPIRCSLRSFALPFSSTPPRTRILSRLINCATTY